uniref:Uncharacterized protein n=1 Tax=Rhizophora mucronata TaxID=61149 RepID=A0A2P2N694_RHIMU
MHDNKMSCSLNMYATGVERAVDQLTLAAPINHAPETKSTSNKQTSSFLAENGPANMMVTQYENNLFSSSLSELINRK